MDIERWECSAVEFDTDRIFYSTRAMQFMSPEEYASEYGPGIHIPELRTNELRRKAIFPGCYAFYCGPACVYVGTASNVGQRALQHLRHPAGNQFVAELYQAKPHSIRIVFFRVPEEERRTYEHHLIATLTPVFNVA